MSAALLAAAALRVVSLDFCADQYALALAGKDALVAVSRDAGADFSYMRREAAGVPRIRPDPEDIARLRPHLALRFWGGDAKRLEDLGVASVTLDYAADFDGVSANIRKAAAALGRAERGEALIAAMDARLKALEGRNLRIVTALYATPGGVTAGRGTFIDAILAAAGVANAAGDRDYWPPLPAESIVADPPELLVTGFFGARSERTSPWSLVRHPALARTLAATPTVSLGADAIACPAWFALDAAEAIADAAERIAP